MPIDEDDVPYMHPYGLGILELSDDEKEIGKDITRDKKKDEKTKTSDTRSSNLVTDVDASKITTKAKEAEPIAIALPFPHRLQKSKLDQQFGRFMEVVKNLQEIETKKRPFNEVEMVAFTIECNEALQANLPPKLKDPGSFSIPSQIVSIAIDKALCDLWASVSVMPYSICQKLNMGQLRVTNMTLQMADRSLRRPLGVLEDVPVRVGKYFIPVDFIVIDMAEDSQVPIILGRPFIHTIGAVIYVRDGSLTL
ncbi:uncharacterized protein LOC141613349 [Silene latifolia]|uniref:uncharacterized protein LOC141613349 n=1 Tax=Silene latifolia TaxID=37657 RepID=UPI003D78677A